ncbi:MAG TPA: hypothetical protein VG605_19005 [Puia sp.]|nr:hypothetical protein [Puia sp.]
MRRLNVRILALALILVFTQKLGLRLWMHRWFHETRALSASHLPAVDTLHPICDCIDDFLMPLTGSALIELPPPVRSYNIVAAANCPPIPTAHKHYSSLRGPPPGPFHS